MKRGGGEKRVSTEEEICFCLFKERGVNWVRFLRWSLIGRERCYFFWVFVCFCFFLWLGGNSLEVALEDFPMSASERWIGFLVWWRCFLSSTKLIFSFRSGGMRPSVICRSTMSSGTGRSQPHLWQHACGKRRTWRGGRGQYSIYLWDPLNSEF